MAINSLGGSSRIGSLADLWVQKIQANKEAKDPTGGEATTVTPDGKIRVNNAGALSVGGTKASEDTGNDDEFTRQIKVQASGMSDEMKAQQLQALNGQAMQIQGQIQQVLVQQAKAAMASAAAGASGGGVSTTA